VSINDPEISTLFGALDLTAVTEDGGAVNAYALRALAKNSNRLISKGHQLFTLSWPLIANDTEIDADIGATFEGMGLPVWSLIHPPIAIPKKPGLTRASFKLYATIPATARIMFQVITRATGAHRIDYATVSDANTVEAIGNSTDTWQTFTFTDVPIDAGSEEVIELYAKTNGGGALAASAFGSNTGTHGSGGVIIGRDSIEHPSSGWSTTAPTLATTGHQVYLYDGSGVLVAPPRTIRGLRSTEVVLNLINVLHSTTHTIDPQILFWPPVNQVQLSQCIDTAGTYEIRASGGASAFTIASFAGYAEARSV